MSRGDFAPVVAAGLVGMAVGSVVAGYIGDRFGRRIALFVSIFLFGAATCAIGLAPNLFVMGLLRFIAELGIGGAVRYWVGARHRLVIITRANTHGRPDAHRNLLNC